MAEKYTILDYAEEVLKASSIPLIYQDIWKLGVEKGLNKKLNLTGKTPWATLGARLYVAVRDKKDTRFIGVGKNPVRFFLETRKSEIHNTTIFDLLNEEVNPKKGTTEKSYNERELHLLLTYVVYTNVEINHGKPIYTKTIYHEKSKKTGYNEWNHPDMVGFYMPIDEWNEKLVEFNSIADVNGIKLYSFEIKKNIDKSNYREYFFQAVSNSSWANEGYLVATDIKDDDELKAELERLSSSFGIGIIKLDIEDIDASEIVLPAKYKNYLEWDLMNKLCELNTNFEDFIDNITKDYKVKTIHKENYDRILDDPSSYIKNMGKNKDRN